MVQHEPELYRNESKFGSIPDIPVGTIWRNREECSKARMHIPTKAGISGGRDGAYSIVMSGGYSDDIDEGDVILYTGAGGRDDENSRYGGGNSRSWGGGEQTKDQTWEHRDNNALRISCERGRPVRVIRGHQLNSVYAPSEGYRYDGLYKVTKTYMTKSKDSGFQICRFELKRYPLGQDPIPRRRN